MMQTKARAGRCFCNRIRVFLNMSLLQAILNNANFTRTKAHGGVLEFEKTGFDEPEKAFTSDSV